MQEARQSQNVAPLFLILAIHRFDAASDKDPEWFFEVIQAPTAGIFVEDER